MAISTLGADLFIAPGTAANTPPTTGWRSGLGEAIVDFPGMSSSVNTIDVTPIIEQFFVRYVKGLADSGGAADIEVNIGERENALITAMRTMAATTQGVLWFALCFPATADSWMFKAEMGPASIPSVTVNDRATQTISIVPNYIVEGVRPKPTGANVTPLVTA